MTGGIIPQSPAVSVVKKDRILISHSNTEILVGECGYVDRDYPDLLLPDLLWQIELKEEASNIYV